MFSFSINNSRTIDIYDGKIWTTIQLCQTSAKNKSIILTLLQTSCMNDLSIIYVYIWLFIFVVIRHK